MKKSIKLCLALAGTLLAVGLVLYLVGTAMGGRRESTRYYEDWWEELAWDRGFGPIRVSSEGVHIGGTNGIHVDSDGVDIGGDHGIHVGHHAGEDRKQRMESGNLTGITGIDVDVDCGDIRLVEGEGFSVSLDWDLDNYAMSYQVEDGVLKIEDESWGNPGTSFDMDIAWAYIEVPAGAALDELELSTDMGDIEVEASISVREANLSTSLGDVTCRALQARELEAESDLGDVTLQLPGSREEYSWELETDMGDIVLEGEKQGGGMGTVINSAGAGKNHVEATTALGNIELSFYK